MEDRYLDLLLGFFEQSRKNWIKTGRRTVKRADLKDFLLEKKKVAHGLDEGVTWENFLEKIDSEEIRTRLDELARNFESDLAYLDDPGLISVTGDTILDIFPWGRVLDFFSKTSTKASVLPTKIDQLLEELSQNSKFSNQTFFTILERLGFVTKKNGRIYSSFESIEEILTDESLFFIEEQDALQIKYGLFNTQMTGAEFLSVFELQGDHFYIKREFGLRKLEQDKLILPLHIDPDIRHWKFRSRIAEIVRLLSKLRQRFPHHTTYRESPELTGDVKLEVKRRTIPSRYIDVSTTLSSIHRDLRSSSVWSQYRTWWSFIEACFTKVMKNREFEKISDFQDRCFRKIFNHLSDSSARTAGLVISAGTGSGKTLSFFGPLLLYLLLEKVVNKSPGTKALCIYPRIKLAENQIESFVKSLFELNALVTAENEKVEAERFEKLTIGIDYTGTPYKRWSFRNDPKPEGNTMYLVEGNINRLWKYDAQQDAYVCPFAKCPKCASDLILRRTSNFHSYVPLTCSDNTCGTIVDYVKYCKEDVAHNPPDILLTTTESLHRRLFDPNFQKLFGTERFHAPKLIMVDEIHLHTSLRGTQIAYLLRRLIKRLEKSGKAFPDRSLGAPIVIGLSATIAYAEEFFSELTGISEHKIALEGPSEGDNIERSGVDYFVFVKPTVSENIAILSNLIQTCMCVFHNMPQSSASTSVHRGLGFVDSLDIVKRWAHDLRDAEQNGRLYTLRDPIRIGSDHRLQNYFRLPAEICEHCKETPNENCILFREGECWWLMRCGHSNSNPLRVFYKTSAEGDVPERYDLVVTTSAMEVGYDDPLLMCIVQYQSPMNIASFTQRRGRGGRKVGDRSITVAVLSPYRIKDFYYYRNHHLLIEPSFEKLPLNPENELVKTIHGFYAAFDLVAFQNRNSGDRFPLYIGGKDHPKLRRMLKGHLKREIEVYIRGLFGYQIRSSELEEIFGLIKKFERYKDRPRYPWQIFPEVLPANLFTNINLPMIDIYKYNVYDSAGNVVKNCVTCGADLKYTPENFRALVENDGKCPQWRPPLCHQKYELQCLEPGVDINLALSEAGIANVTFRWRQTAHWIPPYPDEDSDPIESLKQMNVKNNWLFCDIPGKNPIAMPSKVIPNSLHNITNRIKNGEQKAFSVLRPDIIRVVDFLDPRTQQVSHWLYCEECCNIFAGASHARKFCYDFNNHHRISITERTTSYPFSFYDVRFNRDHLTGGIYNKDDFSNFDRGRIFGTFALLFSNIYFANKRTTEYLNITKIDIGAECHLKTQYGGVAEHTYGFSLDGEDVGLGYNMITEGVDFWFNPQLIDVITLRKEDLRLFNQLKFNIFKFEVLLYAKIPGTPNSFAIDNFLNTYSTFVAKKLYVDGMNHEELLEYVRTGSERMRQEFEDILDRFFSLNPRSRSATLGLLANSEFLEIVREKHQEILANENAEILDGYLVDILAHSLKHMTKKALLLLGGMESERDIGGWTYLKYDFPSFQQRNHLYVFEHGMYGSGCLRSVYKKFETDPGAFWSICEDLLQHCPTADSEEFLKQVLRLPKDEVKDLDKAIERITESKTLSQRKMELQRILNIFREQYHFEIGEEEIKSLCRVFISPLELKDLSKPIRNWKLYQELNIDFCKTVTAKLFNSQRDLTEDEIKEMVFTILSMKKAKIPMPTWDKLFEALKAEEEANFELLYTQITMNLTDPTFQQFFNRITDISELERLHNISREERIVEIIQGGISRAAARILDDSVFTEIEGTPLYELYFYANTQNVPQNTIDKIMAALTRRNLKEEIEKRLLNTCLDSCPACLLTSCEIESPLRSQLILSRRLLRLVIRHLKTERAVCVEPSDTSHLLTEKLKQLLATHFQGYVVYSANKSEQVSEAISELMMNGIQVNGKNYPVKINSTGYREFDLEKKTVKYEIGLRCVES